MSNIQELKDNLKTLEDGLQYVPDNLQDTIKEEIEKTKAEIAALESSQAAQTVVPPATLPATMQPVEPQQTLPQPSEDNGDFLNKMITTLTALMANSADSGVDTPQVRKIIKQYLKDDKVNLEELGESVLEEIRKNQVVELKIPNLGHEIKVSQATAKIPHFYEIVDDVLAGNNVYLIGEAGGGKTYTAEEVSKALRREYVTLNCSQYTSPLEILGGQSIEGFKEGKLINCWRNGKILIIDEMPKLDTNTAGLFNDALAKSTKTKPKSASRINSANAEEPPIERADDFAIIATGNVYPNTAPPEQYKGNNQQDLSLLDRFSGSVYFVEYDQFTDEQMSRYKFLYDMLVGNYHEYILAKKNGNSLPTPIGLRTIIESLNAKNMALASYRTLTSFRVAFEYEWVRAIAKAKGEQITTGGKTLAKTFESYMVAFKNAQATYENIMRLTKFTPSYIQSLVDDCIKKMMKDDKAFLGELNKSVAENAKQAIGFYDNFYAANTQVVLDNKSQG